MNWALDRVRQKVAVELGEVPSDAAALTWVTDFPMFEWCALGPRVYSKHKSGSGRLPQQYLPAYVVPALPPAVSCECTPPIDGSVRPSHAAAACWLRLCMPSAAGPAFSRVLLHIALDANLAAQMQP